MQLPVLAIKSKIRRGHYESNGSRSRSNRANLRHSRGFDLSDGATEAENFAAMYEKLPRKGNRRLYHSVLVIRHPKFGEYRGWYMYFSFVYLEEPSLRRSTSN